MKCPKLLNIYPSASKEPRPYAFGRCWGFSVATETNAHAGNPRGKFEFERNHEKIR
jgi:hypothetical protein